MDKIVDGRSKSYCGSIQRLFSISILGAYKYTNLGFHRNAPRFYMGELGCHLLETITGLSSRAA